MSIALAEAGADIILVQVRLPTHTSTLGPIQAFMISYGS
jgi:hypothetical protein